MDDKNRHLPEEEIMEITEKAMHRTFGYFGLTTLNAKNKGGLGGFVEEFVFKYKANSDGNPDFIDAGIELKVTPIRQNANGTYSSKERLVLNMINYQEEATKTFKTSSFYHKNKKLLIWFYLYSIGVHPSNFEIMNYDLFEFEKSSEFKIIERDWNIIHSKIVTGNAHLISESDTEFLAACTKGADSSKLTDQYNSSVKAKPRAYSFKSGFMTHLYRRIIHEMAPYSPSISEDEWMKNPLEEIYKEKASAYSGKTVDELSRIFHLNAKAKQINSMIARKILGIPDGQKRTYEMEMAGIVFRTITIDSNGRPTESMPFRSFEFDELVCTPWEESCVREDFVDFKLMLLVFKKGNGAVKFDKLVFWNIPNSLVDGPIKEMYESCADLIKNGNAFYYDEKGLLKDKFPKEKRNGNGICHVRPHARNANDKYILPTKDKETGVTSYTKQSFWFNKNFVAKIIKDFESNNQ